MLAPIFRLHTPNSLLVIPVYLLYNGNTHCSIVQFSCSRNTARIPAPSSTAAQQSTPERARYPVFRSIPTVADESRPESEVNQVKDLYVTTGSSTGSSLWFWTA